MAADVSDFWFDSACQCLRARRLCSDRQLRGHLLTLLFDAHHSLLNGSFLLQVHRGSRYCRLLFGTLVTLLDINIEKKRGNHDDDNQGGRNGDGKSYRAAIFVL